MTTRQEHSRTLNNWEHLNDASAKRVVLRYQDPNDGLWYNWDPLSNEKGTATLSNVSGSASSVTLVASNTDRISAKIYNDSSAVLYVKLGATASSTSYTYKLYQDDFVVVRDYTGVIDGIWGSATGAARVTEID